MSNLRVEALGHCTGRDEGVCYKEQFYGIHAHGCIQMTPSYTAVKNAPTPGGLLMLTQSKTSTSQIPVG
jgi:hypothetical protein